MTKTVTPDCPILSSPTGTSTVVGTGIKYKIITYRRRNLVLLYVLCCHSQQELNAK